MASNNNTKQIILDLFIDNVTNDISASDMRSFINSSFDTKEEIIIKIDTLNNLSANNSNIYEGSLVIIWNDKPNNGVYLSVINQPLDINDLILIQATTSIVLESLNPYNKVTQDYEHFLYNFNNFKENNNSKFYYNGDGTLNYEDGIDRNSTIIYNTSFVYDSGKLIEKIILNIENNDQVTISMTYDGVSGSLIEKSSVYLQN